LHTAHELRDFRKAPLGVVHRDVSPHNLFVTVEGQAKVLDFGIAKLDRSLVETEVGTVKGKIRYMAPEQLRGDVLDRRADVYAAGVILWEALAGERMWRGFDDAEIRARVGAGDLPLPPSRPEAPPALARICRRALALDPCRRPPTALAMADELEGILAELGGASTRALGGLVARLFEEPRRRRRAAVEEHVGRVMVEAARATGEFLGVTGEVTPLAALEPPPVAVRAPRWRAATVVAASILALVAASVIWRWEGSRRVGPASSSPAVVPAGVPAILRSPAPTSAPGPAAPAAAAGALLSPAAGEENAPPRVERAVSKRQPRAIARAVDAAPPTQNVAPDCAHPFFIDGEGIKKFRPECM